ncbi:MAG: hypothetical protein IKD55_02275 [Sediminibacterium sp.]|nr:hypothetical protein [Sediminibacterium sp.]
MNENLPIIEQTNTGIYADFSAQTNLASSYNFGTITRGQSIDIKPFLYGLLSSESDVDFDIFKAGEDITISDETYNLLNPSALIYSVYYQPANYKIPMNVLSPVYIDNKGILRSRKNIEYYRTLYRESTGSSPNVGKYISELKNSNIYYIALIIKAYNPSSTTVNKYQDTSPYQQGVYSISATGVVTVNLY